MGRLFKSQKIYYQIITISVMFFCLSPYIIAQAKNPKFKVIAFHDGENDKGHVSFVREADKWFSEKASQHKFTYESTKDWGLLNFESIHNYDVIVFLDSRPDSALQRAAFHQYMENGGAWMGFHFSAFSLSPSAYPQDWDWYHNHFLGSGEYLSNTWRPTTAVLRVENRKHPATRHLPKTFTSSPNEWYRWSNDLRTNPDIQILISIDSTSFPLGTGPKQHEIWHAGYFPVVWSNRNYKMLYINMGHNDIDYENKTGTELSLTFGNKIQNRLIIDGLLELGKRK